jgi:GT2 family glycosyltransferase
MAAFSQGEVEQEPETIEAQLQTARNEIARLTSDLRASERHLAHILELLNQQQSLLNAHQASIIRLDRVFMDVTNGRLWLTLRAVGNIVKKFLPQRETAEASTGKRNTFLVCDVPGPSDRRWRSGIIRVSGWALAEGGVDSIQLEVPGMPQMETKPLHLRPDIKKAYPELDQTGRAGFVFDVDTKSLPNGQHPFLLRLMAGGESVREARGLLMIDHENGFRSEYDRWIHEFESKENSLMEIKVRGLAVKPLISILMPTYNSRTEELQAAIESVLGQTYWNWELCIADDASSKPEVRQLLDSFSALETKRIRVVYRDQQGGISRASNSALEIASGDYICFLDHDDTLAPNALAYVCEAINQNPEADLFYSDEDKIDEEGMRSEPFFKPDWSPDTLRSLNYVCHLLVLRRDLAAKTGLLNPECDGSQDYDLILRATEQATRILHIPKVLYHWRMGEHSTALTLDNKSSALEAARSALTMSAQRNASDFRIESGLVPGRWRVRYPIPEGSRVSIIIASGGKADVLRTNLDSLFAKTGYRDYEVLVADNSRGNLIEKMVNEYSASQPNIRYLDWRDKPFNYSSINNAAARDCTSPLLLFLNDDTSVIDADWLEAMVELAARPDVGAVGAKLLYPYGGIQHAGVVMGIYDNCGHAFKGLDGSKPHYFDFSEIIRNVSAVTGACLMTRAEVFWKVGGFDQVQFAVAFNDVDLCLKIGSAGYRVLYTPHAVLYHHEAFSKTSKDLVPHPDEVAVMRAKWERVIAHDPYYSPNLTRNDENFALRTRI